VEDTVEEVAVDTVAVVEDAVDTAVVAAAAAAGDINAR
jgi:hypothetical protein